MKCNTSCVVKPSPYSALYIEDEELSLERKAKIYGEVERSLSWGGIPTFKGTS